MDMTEYTYNLDCIIKTLDEIERDLRMSLNPDRYVYNQVIKGKDVIETIQGLKRTVMFSFPHEKEAKLSIKDMLLYTCKGISRMITSERCKELLKNNPKEALEILFNYLRKNLRTKPDIIDMDPMYLLEQALEEHITGILYQIAERQISNELDKCATRKEKESFFGSLI